MEPNGKSEAARNVIYPVLSWFKQGCEPFKIAVNSDLNGCYGSTSYGKSVHDGIALIVALEPDLVISTGDMVAGQQVNPHLSSDQIAAMRSAFDDSVMIPLARAGISFVVSPGNHDASAYPGL